MATLPKDLRELLDEPPIYRLMATADLISYEDEHLNPTWRGLVSPPGSTEVSPPMAIKYLGDSSVKIAIELACGLAAFALRLPVPKPALVYCDRTDLPGLPSSVQGDTLLLFGSSFTPEDTIWTRAKANSANDAELVWQHVCNDSVGPKGAAWDELIANPDRHHRNLINDGSRWWLFDHDKAIPPASSSAALATASLANFPEFFARTNILALEMVKRHPRNHALGLQPAEFEKSRDRLKALAHLVDKWDAQDVRIKGVLQDSAFLVGLITSRLPALALHLNNRIGNRDGNSLWT
jgi:hypothetical protein